MFIYIHVAMLKYTHTLTGMLPLSIYLAISKSDLSSMYDVKNTAENGRG